MKNLAYFDLKVLVFIAVTLFSSAIAADENSLSISSRDSSVINSVTEPVLIEAYRRIGIRVEFKRFPGNRSVISANNGQSDGETGRLKFVLKKYQNLRHIPVPIFFSQLSAFTSNPEIKLDGWASLKDYHTVAPGSFKYVVNKLEKCPRATFTADASSALSLLNNGQVDLAVLNRFEGLRLVEVFGYREISVIDPPIESLPIYHLVHKRNEHLIPLLTNALTEMSKDGTLRTIWAENGAYVD